MDGQTEDDVPKECVRATAAAAIDGGRTSRSDSRGTRGDRARTSSGGGESLWLNVERMASELAKRAGVRRKKPSPSSLEREEDEVSC